MNYYDELIVKIDNLINEDKISKARELINNELSLPYVPMNIEEILKERLKSLPLEEINISLTDEDLLSYLNGDEVHQLRAVDELDKKNLRDYLELCNEYLSGNGYTNAKVLLIDSLIKQEINEEIKMNDDGVEYTFIPKYIVPPEISLGFRKAIDVLNEKFMKEPSKLELAKQLVYKECLMALPNNYEEDDGYVLADKVSDYIEEAFR